MKRQAGIFLLFICSVSFTEAGQLLRLPVLISHYMGHREYSGSGSVVRFIVDHYIAGHANDGDEAEDSSLPFKSGTPASILATVPPGCPLVAGHSCYCPDVRLTGYRSRVLFRGFPHGIFHPPRCV